MMELNNFFQHFRPRLLSREVPDEKGYTLQTLIIIAILVLGATIAFTIIYAILDDSTDNIVGGSESFSGIPGPPQNIEIEVGSIDNQGTNELNDDTVPIDISWEDPGYIGENQIAAINPYVVSLRNQPCALVELGPPIKCSMKFALSTTPDGNDYIEYYDLEFEIMLSGGNRHSYPPMRRRIIPDNSGGLNPAEDRLLRGLGPVSNIEFIIDTTYDILPGLTLPEINITSSPCDDGRNDEVDSTIFTVYWSEIEGTQTTHEISFTDCKKIIPISTVQRSNRYIIWIEATKESGEVQVSNPKNWLAISRNNPLPPRDLRIFPNDAKSYSVTFYPPEVNDHPPIDDYNFSIYRVSEYAQCSKPSSSLDIYIDGRIGPKPHNFEQIDTIFELGDLTDFDLCAEAIAYANGKSSDPENIKILKPYYNDKGDFLSWIDVGVWGDMATLTWRATYQEEISYFDILKLSSESDSCSGTDSILGRPLVLNSFISNNTFSANIPLRDANTFFCIVISYADGNESKLTYNDGTKNIPIIRGSNIESLTLSNDSGKPMVKADIPRRYYTSPTPYWVCLEFKSNTDAWGKNAPIPVRQNGSEPDSGTTPNLHDFTYTAPEVRTAGNYDVTAWTSSSGTCTLPSNDYPMVSGIMDSDTIS